MGPSPSANTFLRSDPTRFVSSRALICQGPFHDRHPALRSQRLNQVTHAPHTELDALVKSHKPFDSRESFARFVVAQYLFQSELQALYNDPRLIAIVPDLAQRCRAEQARLDLADRTPTFPPLCPARCKGRAWARPWAGSSSPKAPNWAPRS